MKKRRLRDIEVSEVGMGCMAFSHGYGQIPDEQYSIPKPFCKGVQKVCRDDAIGIQISMK